MCSGCVGHRVERGQNWWKTQAGQRTSAYQRPQMSHGHHAGFCRVHPALGDLMRDGNGDPCARHSDRKGHGPWTLVHQVCKDSGKVSSSSGEESQSSVMATGRDSPRPLVSKIEPRGELTQGLRFRFRRTGTGTCSLEEDGNIVSGFGPGGQGRLLLTCKPMWPRSQEQSHVNPNMSGSQHASAPASPCTP